MTSIDAQNTEGRNHSDLPLLGIGIPTYKRPEQLRRCLESILRSVEAAGGPVVPIHVTDDAGDGTNEEVLRMVGRGYPHLFHHRNPANLGIDRNILRCVDVCAARHVWIMGEDDRMEPEGVATVLGVLDRNPRPFVYVNYASVDEDVAFVLTERSLPLEQDLELSAIEFLRTAAWSAAFIGACVVERAHWETVQAERFVGTYFAHLGRILEYLRDGSAYLVARPLVLNRCGAVRAFTWAESTWNVLEGFGRMLRLLDGLYPAEALEKAAASYRQAHSLGTIRFFAYLRAGGAFDRKTYEKHVRNGPFPAGKRLAARLVANSPPALFQAFQRALRVVRSPRRLEKREP